jgi:hypothetical protein
MLHLLPLLRQMLLLPLLLLDNQLLVQLRNHLTVHLRLHLPLLRLRYVPLTSWLTSRLTS